MSAYDDCDVCGRDMIRGDFVQLPERRSDGKWIVFVCVRCQEAQQLPTARFGG